MFPLQLFRLVFSVVAEIKNNKKKKKRHKNVMLQRSKLNGIESIISKALIDSEICHKAYAIIINEEEI